MDTEPSANSLKLKSVKEKLENVFNIFKWTNKERELSYTYNLVKVLPPFDLLSKFKKTLFQIQIQLILTT